MVMANLVYLVGKKMQIAKAKAFRFGDLFELNFYKLLIIYKIRAEGGTRTRTPESTRP
jgi:hypothetical protein